MWLGRLKWILDSIWPLNQRNWIKQVLMIKFWSGIFCILLHWPKKLTLTNTFCSSFLAQTRSVWKEIWIMKLSCENWPIKDFIMPPKIGARGRLLSGVPPQSKEFFNCVVANYDLNSFKSREKFFPCLLMGRIILHRKMQG